MIGHVGVNVPDLARARTYYAAIMSLVGFEVFLDAADQVAYRPVDAKPGTYLFLYPAADGQAGFSETRPGLQHLAFMVPRRRDVRHIHRTVTEMGGAVLHAPRDFAEYPQPYFATFWRDPWGLKLEAVCHHDRD